MPTLVPLHVTKAVIVFVKTRKKTVVPTMSGFFVWYLKCLLPFITCIMSKLSREAIFLEHLLYFISHMAVIIRKLFSHLGISLK
jgi:hypothetical protein